MSASRRNTTLDGLRGIAAIAVCAYHLSAKIEVPGIFLIRGLIAVDFFFVLSGFVLALTNEERISRGSLKRSNFFLLRIIRFWPMIVLGTIIAATLVLIFGQSIVVDRPIEQLYLGVILSLLCLPVMTSAGALVFFPNNVFWSLLGEIFVNFIFGFLAGISLRLIIVIYAVLFTVFAVAGFEGGYIRFNFQSWDVVGLTMLRVSVSFYAGVLVCRLRKHFGALANVNPLWLAALLVTAVLIPGGLSDLKSAVNLLYIGLIFPMIVWLAADAKPMFAKVGAALGDLSFPLYAIHLPIVAVIAPHLAQLPLIIKIPLMWICVVMLSYLALIVDKRIDLPLRTFLMRAIRPRQPRVIESI